jgi:hypothetical protein
MRFKGDFCSAIKIRTLITYGILVSRVQLTVTVPAVLPLAGPAAHHSPAEQWQQLQQLLWKLLWTLLSDCPWTCLVWTSPS